MIRNAEMELPGSQLNSTLDAIRSDGGTVVAIATPRNGFYKLRILWPQPQQTDFGLNEGPMQQT